MKKILIVTTIPVTFHSILKNQPKFLRSYFNVSLASSDGKYIDDIEGNEEINVNIVPMVRGINPIYDLYSIFKMISLIRKIKPDIVHSYTPKAGLVSMISAFLCRVPSRVHTFTGLIFPTAIGVKKTILTLVDKLICSCATKVIPEGKGVMNDLVQYSITDKTLKLIGFGNIAGVDTDYYKKANLINEIHLDPIRKKFNIDESTFVFCFIGRLTADKGLCELATALQKLPNNTRLLVIGDSDEREPLPAEVEASLMNNPRVHLVGFQDDIRPYLAISQILVLPSYREGFPNVPLQAGAMELPCIVSNINGCNEIIKNDFNGWLVESKDESGLINAMIDSMKSEQLTFLGKNARANVISKFERNDHWQRMLAFYSDELLKK